MNLSVEISMYPLQDDYKIEIKDFLAKINQVADEQIEILSSNMSTRIFGNYDAIMDLLREAMKYSMAKYGKMVFVCKFLQGDARELRGYD